MDNNRGISLVELITTVAIICITGTAIGISYAEWMTKYKIEKQIGGIYADLMSARVMAITRGQTHFADFTDSKTYRIIEDTDENNDLNTGSDAVMSSFPKTVEYENSANGYGIPLTFKFNSRGSMSPLRTIWINHSTDPDYDCIVVSTTRINLGKMSSGTCVQK